MPDVDQHSADCPCVCHTAGAAFRPACDVPGGCGRASTPVLDRIREAMRQVDAAQPDGPVHPPAPGPSSKTDKEADKPRPLPELVAELVDPTTVRVRVETRSTTDGHLLVERREHTVRPVLAELRAAVTPSGQTGGGGRGGGLPLSLDALDTLDRIRGVVDVERDRLDLRARDATLCTSCSTPATCCSAGVDPRTGRPIIGTYGAPCCSRHRHAEPVDPVEDVLRQLAVTAWPALQLEARDSFARQLAALTARARGVLDGDGDAERVRDTRCPVPTCRAENIRIKRDGGWERVPPLRIERARVVAGERGELAEDDGRRGPIRGTRCDACGRWWPWEAMQGPRAGEPAGELWDLLVADALEVIRVDHRAAELAERGRRYSPADAPRAAELGLPHYRKGEATG